MLFCLINDISLYDFDSFEKIIEGLVLPLPLSMIETTILNGLFTCNFNGLFNVIGYSNDCVNLATNLPLVGLSSFKVIGFKSVSTPS